MTPMMKLKYILLMSCAYTFQAVAQDIKESQVPSAVIAEFKSKYPGAYVYEWEFKKKESRYEGEFMDDGVKREASFGPDGAWLWTSRELEKDSLPQPVSSGLMQSEYGHWEVDEIEERESSSGLGYLIEVESKKKEVLLFFKSDGTLEKVSGK